jgi:hypothetical protein
MVMLIPLETADHRCWPGWYATVTLPRGRGPKSLPAGGEAGFVAGSAFGWGVFVVEGTWVVARVDAGDAIWAVGTAAVVIAVGDGEEGFWAGAAVDTTRPAVGARWAHTAPTPIAETTDTGTATATSRSHRRERGFASTITIVRLISGCPGWSGIAAFPTSALPGQWWGSNHELSMVRND